jgi:hypothetical protein
MPADETDRTYEAFLFFYLAPSGDRNLRELAKKSGKYRTQFDP